MTDASHLSVRRRRTRLLALIAGSCLLLAAGVLLAGCGGGGHAPHVITVHDLTGHRTALTPTNPTRIPAPPPPAPAKVPRGSHWVASWEAAPERASRRSPRALRGFHHVTLREIVYPSVGGARVQVRFSNQFGLRPLRIGEASIAQAGGQRTAVASPGVALTFHGQEGVTIPPGQVVESDPARFEVRPLRDLAISLYLPGRTGTATVHTVADQINFVAAGNRTLATHAESFADVTPSWYFLTGVSVLAPARVEGAIVALGDSITDGFHARLGANSRWPNVLARRLAGHRGPTYSVVDAGIAGNRILTDSRCYGTRAMSRIRRDVFSQPDAKAVILLEGVNDIGMAQSSAPCDAPYRHVTAEQIIHGDERIIKKVHAAGLKIYGATILPFGHSQDWTPAGERERETVNHWIVSSGAFDGIFDLAASVASPINPIRLARRFDSGDHVHPNSFGYQAMAKSMPLSELLQPLSPRPRPQELDLNPSPARSSSRARRGR